MNNGIDEYILNAQPFARPILKKLRTIIHGLGAEIVETIKWGSPVYVHHGNLCMTWAFKEHAAIYFFKGTLIEDVFECMQEADKNNVASRSIRFYNVEDLNEDILRDYLLQAIEINKKGIKPKATKNTTLTIPLEFQKIMKKYRSAFKYFETLSHSRKLYLVEYYMQAKKEETRARRLEKILEILTAHK